MRAQQTPPAPSRIDPFVRPAPQIDGVRIHDSETHRGFYGPPQAIIDAGLADPTWFGGHRTKNGKWYSVKMVSVMGLRIETRVNEQRTQCSMSVWPTEERKPIHQLDAIKAVESNGIRMFIGVGSKLVGSKLVKREWLSRPHGMVMLGDLPVVVQTQMVGREREFGYLVVVPLTEHWRDRFRQYEVVRNDSAPDIAARLLATDAGAPA